MGSDFSEQTATDAVVASFAGHARPAAARDARLPHPAPARLRPRRRAHPARMGDGDRFLTAAGTSATTRARSSSCSPTCWASRCWSTRSTTGSRPAPPSRPCSARSTSSSRRCASSATTSPTSHAQRVPGPRPGPRPGRRAGAPAPHRRLAGRRPGLLRRAEADHARGTCAACSPPTTTAVLVRPCVPSTTRSRTTGRSASCCARPAGTRTGRRTSTSSPARPATAPVTTHLFVEGSPYLDDDTVFGVKQSLIRAVADDDDPVTAAGSASPTRSR